ncbi:hypothetical protein [Spongiactinospora sp. TRM90649]|uniref:hypothetical protein n=1 Tax=Spongiactinospora sp. TRM90649 TaxID=3031114 RepID=UPI0023FA0528|nr:hypothetical protein [Spongiactinospora sp. TRM90649]MDF5752369.1 hypothetical protein [Spongiactinospora sp. TRM90649]
MTRPATRGFAVAAALAVLVSAAGCAGVGEVSGALVRVQACEEAIAVATKTPEEIQRAAPAEVEKSLGRAAEALEKAAGTAGDATLRKAMEGLAESYRDLKVTDTARAEREVAATTAKFLQVISASCATT